jgi:hypothetical protein
MRATNWNCGRRGLWLLLLHRNNIGIAIAALQQCRIIGRLGFGGVRRRVGGISGCGSQCVVGSLFGTIARVWLSRFCHRILRGDVGLVVTLPEQLRKQTLRIRGIERTETVHPITGGKVPCILRQPDKVADAGIGRPRASKCRTG